MPISKKRWFCEEAVPGKRFGKIKHCFSIDKLVFKGKTPHQRVFIFDNAIYGRIAVLDGIVQFSQKDEFIYHETIVHPILFSHPNPQKILIIGGGDGGVLREVVKHPVKEVYLVDIDKKAVEIFKKYTPFVARDAFGDPRLKMFFEDGRKFIKRFRNFFDVVIVDSNDPVGSSLPLFSEGFYKDLARVLKRRGMMISLIGSFLDFETLIKKTVKKIKHIFPKVQLYRMVVPSYHCGDFCFIGASKEKDLAKISLKNIKKRLRKVKKKNNFKYYSPKMHLVFMTFPEILEI
jgi:spermidine synthase